MDLSDWISIVSIVVVLGALAYSIISNTKKYELTYQYYKYILQWHNQVVKILILLRLSAYAEEQKLDYLSKLSALIESGRFTSQMWISKIILVKQTLLLIRDIGMLF